MLDPLVALSFALYSNKGAYALLLGSGISSSAQIPTGYNVVLDLLRKVARLRGESCEPDPARWWEERTGKEPDYSELLDQLAKTPIERQHLLKGYFEPTVAERQEGTKVPTLAHNAIARLVANGFIHVVITTNFDRLLEQALEANGISAAVISTADQVRGAVPLAHSGPVVIKVNGDYLDTRIKNTESELARYEKPLVKLLDRVFDEYGLLICGWSGNWDIALRASIMRAPSRRFSTFVALHGTASDAAKRLIQARGAQEIPIKDANSFFVSLEEKVQALQDSQAQHPLSANIAIATTKRYLAEPTANIRLHDLIREEVERVHAVQLSSNFSMDIKPTNEDVLSQTRRYEALVSTLLAMTITGAFWGDDIHIPLWVHAIERIGAVPPIGGYDWAVKLRGYPALLLLYGAGIAAVAAKKYSTVAAVLEQPLSRKDGEESPLLFHIQPFTVMQNQVGYLLPGMDKHYTPLSDHLFRQLRDPLHQHLPDDAVYDEKFDEFEYLMSLVATDLSLQLLGGRRTSYGRFAWKGRNLLSENKLSKYEKEIETAGDTWPPLCAGMFAGDLTRLIKAKVTLSEWINSFSWNF
jgi:hypothetical protein